VPTLQPLRRRPRVSRQVGNVTIDHADIRAMSNATITLVTGAPCSGKSTYVAEHKAKRDVVIDYDAIAVALGSPNTHDHPKSLVPYILNARDSLLDRIASKRPTTNVWIVACAPSTQEQQLADTTITLDTDMDTCIARAHDEGRPAPWPGLIREWFVSHM